MLWPVAARHVNISLTVCKCKIPFPILLTNFRRIPSILLCWIHSFEVLFILLISSSFASSNWIFDSNHTAQGIIKAHKPPPPYHGMVAVFNGGKYVYISLNIWHAWILHFPWKSNCVANTIYILFTYTRWLIYISLSDLPSFTDKYAMILYIIKCYDQLLQGMSTYL